MSQYNEIPRKPIPPLMKSNWGNHSPFGLKMPICKTTDRPSGEHVSAGCNTIALALIVNFHAQKGTIDISGATNTDSTPYVNNGNWTIGKLDPVNDTTGCTDTRIVNEKEQKTTTLSLSISYPRYGTATNNYTKGNSTVTITCTMIRSWLSSIEISDIEDLYIKYGTTKVQADLSLLVHPSGVANKLQYTYTITYDIGKSITVTLYCKYKDKSEYLYLKQTYSPSQIHDLYYPYKKRGYDITKLKDNYSYLDGDRATCSYNSTNLNYTITGRDTEKEVALFIIDCALATNSIFNSDKTGSTAADDEITIAATTKFGLKVTKVETINNNAINNKPNSTTEVKLKTINLCDTYRVVKNALNNITNWYMQLPLYENMIYSELSLGRPVVIAGVTPKSEAGNGGGHIWIIDGYLDGLFHCNWGWQGRGNGWHDLSLLNTYYSGYKLITGNVNHAPAYGTGSNIYFNVSAEDGNKNISFPFLVKPDRAKWSDVKVVKIDTSLFDGISKNDSIIKVTLKNTNKLSDLLWKYYADNGYKAMYKCKIRLAFQKITDGKFTYTSFINILIPRDRELEAEFNGPFATSTTLLSGDYNLFIQMMNDDEYPSITGEAPPYKSLYGINSDSEPFTLVLHFEKKEFAYPSFPSSGAYTFLNNCYAGLNKDNTYPSARIVYGNTIYLRWNINNPNSYPIYCKFILWIRFMDELKNSDTGSYNSNRYTLYRDNAMDYKIITFLQPGLNKIPIIMHGIPSNSKFELYLLKQFTNSAGDKVTIGKITNNYIMRPCVSYWDRNYKKTIIFPTKDGTEDKVFDNYSNSQYSITIPNTALAVDFRGVGNVLNIILEERVSKNALFYFDNSQIVPNVLNGYNIIKGELAESIKLIKDNFIVPITFTAQHIEYTVNYSTGTNVSTKNTSPNWKSIALPFDVDKVMVEDKEITWFTSDNSKGDFWLKEFSGINYDSLDDNHYNVSFNYPESMKSYTTYCIAIPDDSYGEYSLVNKDLTFIGSNITLNKSTITEVLDGDGTTIKEGTETLIVPQGNIRMLELSQRNDDLMDSSTFKNTTSVIDFCGTLKLRRERYIYTLNSKGNAFVYSENALNVVPFEGYFKEANRRYLYNKDVQN